MSGPPITGRVEKVGGIVQGGEIIEVPGLEVLISERYWWDPEKTRAARWRKNPPRAVLWHHTGGEGDGRQICRTLESRKTRGAPDGLSVGFTVSRGIIRQHADLNAVTLHGGRVSPWTAGVEVQNRGHGKPAKRWPRVQYQDTAHGREITFLRFLPEDVAACLALFDALSSILEIPKTFPMGKDGKAVRGLVPKETLETYRGHLGHLHVSRRKVDPSPHLMDDLMARASLPT